VPTTGSGALEAREQPIVLERDVLRQLGDQVGRAPIQGVPSSSGGCTAISSGSRSVRNAVSPWFALMIALPTASVPRGYKESYYMTL